MAESSQIEDSLRERWDVLNSEIDADIRTKWWKTICTKYNEDIRKYHTLSHISKMFKHMDSNLEEIHSPNALSYAIFFHDIEYNVQSQSNEEDSVVLFEKFIKESNLHKKEELRSQVMDLILLSKSHCTEAHITEGAFGDDDSHYFLDFDVSILGSDKKEYEEYADQIREEYKYLSDDKYNSLRTKVLKLFIQIPNIYATKVFRDQLEMKARGNIKAEISKLNTDSV